MGLKSENANIFPVNIENIRFILHTYVSTYTYVSPKTNIFLS